MENQKDPQTYAIIGAAMKVHSELGHGFLEAVYQDALEIELKLQNIPYEREKQVRIYYAGQLLPSYYVMDFLCFESIVVETKAIKMLTEVELAQTLNYLKATHLEKALLINFGSPRLEHKRYINTDIPGRKKL